MYASMGDACPCCGTPWSNGDAGGAPNRVTIDRLVPGGSYKDASNLRILCGRCNAAKGDLTAPELRRIADWIDREMGESAT